MQRRDLEGRSAIVTGGAMGIGRASAEALAGAGANVVIADRDREQGEATAKALIDAGASVHFIETDVTSLAAMEALAAETVSLFGGIDILVNNAARALGGVVDETDEETWNLTLSTNLSSVWRGMKVCVPHMRKKGKGAIVNMSSVQALTGFKGWAAYAAAKGGVNALTQQAAIDLASAGIRVNAIAPGTIMTPLNQKIFASHPDPQGLIDSWNKAHPLGRFGEASEVAEAVLFLASDRSSFITGEILRVDGGLVVKGE
jgi:NAD(P)-dependent dehydrogenase (short-subunit alcohol dehydrogenase family)